MCPRGCGSALELSGMAASSTTPVGTRGARLIVRAYRTRKVLAMDRWKGMVAPITGGASGIGRRAAERMAGEGARVAITERKHQVLPGGIGEFVVDGGITVM